MNIIVPPQGSTESLAAPALSVAITRTADGKIVPVRESFIP